MKKKKLKDLRKGDRIWYRHFTCTTPIFVESAKRDGDLMRVTVRWDDEVYECFGPALGFTCVGYNRKFCDEIMFTCSFEISDENEKRIQRIRNLVPKLKEVIWEMERK